MDYANGIVVIKLTGKPVSKKRPGGAKFVTFEGGTRILCLRQQVLVKGNTRTTHLKIDGIFTQEQQEEYKARLCSLIQTSPNPAEPKKSGYRYGMPCAPKWDQNVIRPLWWDQIYTNPVVHRFWACSLALQSLEKEFINKLLRFIFTLEVQEAKTMSLPSSIQQNNKHDQDNQSIFFLIFISFFYFFYF